MQENTARKLPVPLPSVPETISRPLFGHSPYHWDIEVLQDDPGFREPPLPELPDEEDIPL
jgi:hypothetical protein